MKSLCKCFIVRFFEACEEDELSRIAHAERYFNDEEASALWICLANNTYVKVLRCVKLLLKCNFELANARVRDRPCRFAWNVIGSRGVATMSDCLRKNLSLAELE